MLVTQESMAAKVVKVKQELPELQAYEWVCIIVTHFKYEGIWYSSVLQVYLYEHQCIFM